MDKKVQDRFIIQSYESDLFRRLKPFFLQCHVQELAYRGSEFCGASYEDLRKDNLFWALNRIRLNIREWPLWGEEVCLQTWSRCKAGPLWHRNFRMFRPGREESPLMLGTSAWTMLDIASRSICRDEHGFNTGFHLEEDTLPFCQKIAFPRGIPEQDAGSHTVGWNDLDSNAHANNCMYTQWAVDSIPLEYLQGHVMGDVQVNYYHELHYGDTVRFGLTRDGDAWYLRGLLGDTICFTVRMEFIPAPGQ